MHTLILFIPRYFLFLKGSLPRRSLGYFILKILPIVNNFTFSLLAWIFFFAKRSFEGCLTFICFCLPDDTMILSHFQLVLHFVSFNELIILFFDGSLNIDNRNVDCV